MTRRIHVIPVGDTDLHCAQADCWCFPVEDDGVWVHNAKDCREVAERFTPGKVSDGWVLIAEKTTEFRGLHSEDC